MPGSSFFTVLAGIVRGITMGPSVMPISGGGWPCAAIFVGIGQGGSEFCDVLQCLY